VGVYFVTQNPGDVPEDILGQLGNRVQHALRAFTARDQKDLRLAADTYRPNPRFSTEDAIRDVGTGEAVTSFLEAKGIPGVVERTLIRPPSSQLGPIAPEQRRALVAASPLAGKYETLIDRVSAYEKLQARVEQAEAAEAGASEREANEREAGEREAGEREFSRGRRYGGETKPAAPKPAPRPKTSGSRSDSVTEAFAKSFARQIGSKAGQAVVRGVLGSLFRRR